MYYLHTGNCHDNFLVLLKAPDHGSQGRGFTSRFWPVSGTPVTTDHRVVGSPPGSDLCLGRPSPRITGSWVRLLALTCIWDARHHGSQGRGFASKLWPVSGTPVTTDHRVVGSPPGSDLCLGRLSPRITGSWVHLQALTCVWDARHHGSLGRGFASRLWPVSGTPVTTDHWVVGSPPGYDLCLGRPSSRITGSWVRLQAMTCIWDARHHGSQGRGFASRLWPVSGTPVITDHRVVGSPPGYDLYLGRPSSRITGSWVRLQAMTCVWDARHHSSLTFRWPVGPT